MPSTSTEFLERLLTFPKGRIVLCNIVAGLDSGIIDSKFAEELLDWWKGLFDWKYPGSKLPEKIMGALDLLLYHDKDKGFRPGQTKPNFLLAGRKFQPSDLDTAGELITIIDAESFREYVIHEDDHRRLFRRVRTLGDHKHTLVMTDDAIKVRPRTSATIGNPKKLLWFAPDKNGSALLSAMFSHPEKADHIRDLLGLKHHEKDTELIAIHLPIDTIRKMTHARPTVADSGGHERFKSNPDTECHSDRQAWGCTVNLEKLAANAEDLDGWPERVCEPIHTDPIDDIRVTALGVLNTTHGETKADSDKVFAGRICHGKTDEDILNCLGSLR